MRTDHLLTGLALVVMSLAVGCSTGGTASSAPSGASIGTPATTPFVSSSGVAASSDCVPVADPQVAPPTATPLAEPPQAPAGDGTRATLETEAGDIVVELFTSSSPVAAENFANLARAGFYDCLIFHRVIPGFVIQGGDPDGTGRGGPGYTIRDDAVVGEYEQGFLAMARPAGQGGALVPDSQGSQFFIILDDLRERLPKSGMYAIFGRVVAGMDVVEAIAAGQTTGSPDDRPVDPVTIRRVTVQAP